jgi:uncharacterized protein GlcG (DUF336 family)
VDDWDQAISEEAIVACEQGGTTAGAAPVASAADESGEISWRTAHALVGCVLEEADSRGLRVAVAVIDRWGRPAAFQRIPGTVMTSSNIAKAKAFTACNFNAPVHSLVQTISREHQEELGRLNDGLVFAGGGFPIRLAGRLLGGIGVSGASEEEDAELALRALTAAALDTTFDL